MADKCYGHPDYDGDEPPKLEMPCTKCWQMHIDKHPEALIPGSIILSLMDHAITSHEDDYHNDPQ